MVRKLPVKYMGKRGRAENLTNAGKGRPKGSANKFTSFKNSILQVYQDLGGDKAFCEWAKKSINQGDFYKMASKLLPKEVEVSGKDGQPLQINIVSDRKSTRLN